MNKEKGHSSGNGDQARHLGRERRPISNLQSPIQNQLDRAVALADQEIADVRLSIADFSAPTAANRQSTIDNRQSSIPVAGVRPVPPTPAPEKISISEYTARLEQGWVPVLGLPGTPITAGYLRELGEYNPKLEGLNGIWTYQEMRRGDGQVAGTLRACKLPILSAQWNVVAPPVSELGTGFEIRDSGLGLRDSESGISNLESQISNLQSPISNTGAGRATVAKAKEVADFIRENLMGGLEWQTHSGSWITQDWKDVVRFALRMQDFGAACVEEVYTVDGSKVRLRRLADRQALTFYRWHTDPHSVDPSLPPYIYDDGETLYALEQWGYRSNRFEYVLLPMDKACVFTHEQEGANFWGIPLTRAMYPHWYVKKHLERIDAIACERNSLGVPMIMLPPNPSRQDVQTAQQWVTQLAAHEKTGLSLPNGAEFKLVGIEGRIREILPSLEYHKRQIATSCLAMFMELGQTRVGSRALGESQTDFFLMASQNTAEYIAARLRNSTIRRLVQWNFGPDAPVPYLVPANVQARSVEAMSAIIAQLAGAKAWVSDRSSINQLRNELGFEDLAADDVSAMSGLGTGHSGGKVADTVSTSSVAPTAISDSDADDPDASAPGPESELNSSESGVNGLESGILNLEF